MNFPYDAPSCQAKRLGTYLSNYLYLLLIIISFYSLFKILDIHISNIRNLFKFNTLKEGYLLQTYLMQSENDRKFQHLPTYKFYSELVLILFNCRTTFGGEIETSLFELRKSIVIDIKETRKVRDMFYGGLIQSLFLGFFVIGFYYYSRIMIGAKINLSEIFFLAGWNLGGVCLYVCCFKYLEIKKFKLFSSYLCAFYKFKILLSISRPINEIIESSQINKLRHEKKIGHLRERIEQLVKKIKNSGQFSRSEIDFLLREIWDFFEFELTHFQKMMGVIKFLSLLLFILPSFLYSSFSLISSLNL